MTIFTSITSFLVLILFLIYINPSQQCLLHDMINSTSNGYGKMANMNNETLLDIFQKSRTLLQEIPEGNGILVQLNSTGTNISTLALIVENNSIKNNSTGDSDIFRHYRMYYVTLQHEQIGYRLYFKLMREYFKNQMSTMYQTFSSSMNAIGRFWRPTNPKHDDNSATITETSPMLPVLMKTVDVPSRIEERVFEIVTGNQTFKNNQENNVTEKIMNEPNEKASNSIEMLRLLMKVISAFRGNFVPNKPALVKHGIIITDKNVKITINAEQKVSGDIDVFIGDPSSNDPKRKPQTNQD